MTAKRVRGIVTGRVQGVAYRWSAVSEAHRLGVSGWVRNLDDGRVEFEAEATPEAVDAFVEWCRTGPAGASVVDVETTRLESTGERGFRTIYS